MRIVTLVANSMAFDTRVRRHATAMADAGHQVTAIGLLLPRDAEAPSLPAHPGLRYAWADRRARALPRGTAGWLASGVAGRIASAAWSAGVRSDSVAYRFVAPSYDCLLREARRHPADVYYANDLNTLPVALTLCARHGAALVYDAHEVYQEEAANLSPGAREAIRQVEAAGMARASARITVSGRIAEYLQRSYGCARPMVVRNLPHTVDLHVDAVPPEGSPVRVLYHAAHLALNGRQLKDLVDAAAGSSAPLFLTLRGRLTPSRQAELAAYLEAKLPARWALLPPVAPEALVQEAARHDVGVVLNSDANLNEQLGLPNKLFEYLMAGLAIVAYRTEPLAEIVEGGGLGAITQRNTVADLRSALERVIGHRGALTITKQRCRRAALDTYNWDVEKRRLADAIAEAAGTDRSLGRAPHIAAGARAEEAR